MDLKLIVGLLSTIFSLFMLMISFYHTNHNSYQLSITGEKDKFENINLLQEQQKQQIVFRELSTMKPITNKVSINAYNSNKGKYAYITLLHGIDDSFKYRGFLYNAIIFKKLIEKFGSKADVIVMVGFTYDQKTSMYDDDFKLLRSFNIKIHFLPRILPNQKGKISFAEMALLKITPWSLIEYEKIQYFDGDVIPKSNLDSFFQFDRNTFNTGTASPINSGWFLAIPNMEHYEAMLNLAKERLSSKWDTNIGWGKTIPNGLYFRGNNKEVADWNFNGASLDQGLFTYYFMLNKGFLQLLDLDESRLYDVNYNMKTVSLDSALRCCGSKLPVERFAHFTGRNKPWLKKASDRIGKDMATWFETLDSLHLNVTSSSMKELGLGSSLGYFHPNK